MSSDTDRPRNGFIHDLPVAPARPCPGGALSIDARRCNAQLPTQRISADQYPLQYWRCIGSLPRPAQCPPQTEAE